MYCSWYTHTLAMLGKRDRFTEKEVIREFSERIKNKISFDSDLDRKLDGGESESPIFATRVCTERYTIYWELDKNKSAAYVLAFLPTGSSYFKSVKILSDFIDAFKEFYSNRRAIEDTQLKNQNDQSLFYQF